MDTLTVRRAVWELDVNDSPEAAADLWVKLECAKKEVTEIERQAREQLAKYIEEHGELDLGDGRKLVLKTSKRWVVRDLAKAVDAVLTACGGDVDVFIEHLSSNALKYGEVRKTLDGLTQDLDERGIGGWHPPAFEDLFELVESKKPQEKEAPKRLSVIDTKWIKGESQ